MCLAVPAKIVSIEGAFAQVDMMGFQSRAYIDLIKDAAVGQYVLVHAGCAIERIQDDAFDFYMNLCREISEG
ncbi:MAG: HypC/HybG/HupF family hydrogenase formation chaperone [Clostridia bacterium]|jgi:hydrogenase expression/formation protein HypC|nr:HypC/HybG/HupF family hydrogenase formation chaperone [Clostridia bacterium]